MKKAVKKVISCLLMGVISVGMMSNAFAADIEAKNTQEALVLSGEIPNDVIDFAKQNFASSITGLEAVYNIDFEAVSLGSPYTVQGDVTMYSFPVMVNDSIEFLYYVYKQDGSYTGSLMEGYASQLQSAIDQNANDVTLSITFDEDETAQINVVNTMPYAFNQNVSYSQIMEKIEFERTESIEPYYVVQPTHKQLGVRPQGLQGSLPWCNGYSAATILSSIFNSDITPLMIANYGGHSTSDAIENYTIIGYANAFGVYPSWYNGKLSTQTLKDTIFNGAYILAQGDRFNGDVWKARHAVVVRGYTPTEILTWNPQIGYQSTSHTSSTFPGDSGRVYYWDGGYTNWK